MNNTELTQDQLARLESAGISPDTVCQERAEIEKMYNSLVSKLTS